MTIQPGLVARNRLVPWLRRSAAHHEFDMNYPKLSKLPQTPLEPSFLRRCHPSLVKHGFNQSLAAKAASPTFVSPGSLRLITTYLDNLEANHYPIAS